MSGEVTPQMLEPVVAEFYENYIGWLGRMGASSEMDEVAVNTRDLLGKALNDDGVMRVLALMTSTAAQAHADDATTCEEHAAVEAVIHHTAVMVLHARTLPPAT